MTWTYEDATRHHKFLALCDAWISDTNAGISRHRLKQLTHTAQRITLATEESNLRETKRGWEWAVPVDKFPLAYPGEKPPTSDEVGEQRFGVEIIEGKQTKVIYMIKDCHARPWCYDVSTKFTEGTRLTEVLDEAHSDSDEDRHRAVKEKKEQAASITHQRNSSMSAMAFNALKALAATGFRNTVSRKAEPKDADSSEDEQPVNPFAEAMASLKGDSKKTSTAAQRKPSGTSAPASGSSSIHTVSPGASVAPRPAVKAERPEPQSSVKGVDHLDADMFEEEEEDGPQAAQAEGEPRKQRGRPRKVVDLTEAATAMADEIKKKITELKPHVEGFKSACETWDLRDPKACKDAKKVQGDKATRIQTAVKKWDQLGKKVSPHKGAGCEDIDKFDKEITETMELLNSLMRVCKALHSMKVNLTVLLADVEICRQQGVQFGEAQLVQFKTWETDELLRVQKFDDLTCLYDVDSIKARFDAQSVDAMMQSSVWALETAVTRLFEDLTSTDFVNDSLSVVTLRSCTNAFLGKGDKLVSAAEMKQSLEVVELP